MPTPAESLDAHGGVRPQGVQQDGALARYFVCRGLVEGCYAIWPWRGPTDPGTWELSGYQVNCRAARTPRNVSRGVPPRGYRRLGFSPWPQFDSGFTCNRWRLPRAKASCPQLMTGDLACLASDGPHRAFSLRQAFRDVRLQRAANSSAVTFHILAKGGWSSSPSLYAPRASQA